MATMAFDLGLSQRINAEDHKRQQEVAEFGESVELKLRLPDGSDKTMQLRMGNSVQYVKVVLHQEFDVPLNVRLSCEGRDMLDPLSLSDCAGIGPGRPNVVEITEEEDEEE